MKTGKACNDIFFKRDVGAEISCKIAEKTSKCNFKKYLFPPEFHVKFLLDIINL